jgi:stage II sporulation protein D
MGLVASTTKASPIPVAFEITGRGFGHGLGLSQWGAYNMAMQGQSYQQILQHYYQGTTLSKVEVK